jgi:hypothetical protein
MTKKRIKKIIFAVVIVWGALYVVIMGTLAAAIFGHD